MQLGQSWVRGGNFLAQIPGTGQISVPNLFMTQAKALEYFSVKLIPYFREGQWKLLKLWFKALL